MKDRSAIGRRNRAKGAELEREVAATLASQWRNRPSASERGYGRGWKVLRKRVMQRDSWLCQPCLRRGASRPPPSATWCPKAQGGTDDEGNLQAICADCHKANLRQQSLRRHPRGNLSPGSRESGRKARPLHNAVRPPFA
ncbi:HNH endonuclease [Rhodovulum sulfidophilum]|uniref:HNH endonuclease n=1 Tax=Rhodovulum sulfidophilum TaxID=35806 RepID=UPI0019266E8F|nr:HNH endonuclease [Rhodovulum sulfidophilum]